MFASDICYFMLIIIVFNEYSWVGLVFLNKFVVIKIGTIHTNQLNVFFVRSI